MWTNSFLKNDKTRNLVLVVTLMACGLSLAHAAEVSVTTVEPPLVTGFDARAWQADYAFLKQQLQTQYANLAWFASPQGKVNLPQLDTYTRKALALAENDEQAKAVLRNFIDAFHDGHLRLIARPNASVGITESEPPAVAIENMDMENACAAIGVGSTSRLQFSLPFESLPGFTLFSDGVTQAFRAGIITTERGNKLGMLRIPRFREVEYPGLCAQAWKMLASGKQGINTKQLKKAMTDAWFEVLAAHLARMKTAGAQAVLVDVGGNGGGNDSGDWSARLLTSRAVRSAPLLMAAGPIAQAYLDEELQSMRKSYDDPDFANTTQRSTMQAAITMFEKALASMSASSCDLSWVWQEQRPWQVGGCSNLAKVGFASGPYAYLPVSDYAETSYVSSMYWAANADKYRGSWTGPVYVMTDRGVGSAAEAFVAILKDNAVIKTMGTLTGGSGCGNMQAIRPIVLPHSKLSFQAPDCVRLRADGSDEVMGITPDLPLDAVTGESDRARAARAIKTMERDMSGINLAP
ncbi:S41 family peptidase [Undibacterium sp. Ji50W]|uniref:S41 family peptidase n=1 Tax=Undibacterium sp. Ji50W TaxID=3413041 RepID=UPI003BF42753